LSNNNVDDHFTEQGDLWLNLELPVTDVQPVERVESGAFRNYFYLYYCTRVFT